MESSLFEIFESVKNRRIFVLQSIFPDPNRQLMQLFLILDALKRAAAKDVTVILPYYGYARQDRLDKPGTPITAKLMADLISISGVSRIITMDLHSEQIEGFFDIPVQHLLSRSLLIPFCQSLELKNLIVMAPDKGGIKIAVSYAKQIGCPVGLMEKVRIDPYHVNIQFFIGEVADCTVLIPDDMCSTGEPSYKQLLLVKKRGQNK